MLLPTSQTEPRQMIRDMRILKDDVGLFVGQKTQNTRLHKACYRRAILIDAPRSLCRATIFSLVPQCHEHQIIPMQLDDLVPPDGFAAPTKLLLLNATTRTGLRGTPQIWGAYSIYSQYIEKSTIFCVLSY